MFVKFKKDGLAEKELAFMTGIETALNEAFTEGIKGMVDQKGLDAKLAEIQKSIVGKGLDDAQLQTFTDTVESVKTQALAIQKLTNRGGESELKTSIKAQLKAYIDANPEAWDAFKTQSSKSFGIKMEEGEGGKKMPTAGIELKFYSKAAATMTVGTSTGGSAFVPNVEMVPGLVELARNQPFLENYANTSSTSSARIVWVEKTNPQGQAGMTAEGALKPLVSFEVKTNESFAKKVTDKIKVSTEMLDDIDFIAGEIENELKYQVDIKVDNQLLSGDGTGQNLKGISAYAGGFVLTTVKTSGGGTPNDADAIRAAIAQIVTLNFRPTTAFINPIDAANMDLTKNTQGSYIIPPFQSSNGLSIAGVTIVESNQVPVGQLLIGDMSKFVVRNYKSFAIQYGWVNDDFELNLVTIIGERRLHSYVADNNTGAFVYDSFATIKAAITPAA